MDRKQMKRPKRKISNMVVLEEAAYVAWDDFFGHLACQGACSISEAFSSFLAQHNLVNK